MKIFITVQKIILASFLVFSYQTFAASPSQPILPSDNIQDPGNVSTLWGGCGPTDANCYVTLTSFYNESVDGLDYSTSTGILSISSGYTIPTVASTTAWNNAIGSLLGNALLQDGNSFGTTLTLGTDDAENLSFETGGISRLTVDTAGNIVATGTITANSFYGDGSNLAGIFSTSTTRNILSASAPLSYNASTGNFLISQASSTSDGYLSSANFNIFSAKENAIAISTSLTYLRGDKTFQTLDTSVVTENGNLYFTNMRADARAISVISATTSLPNVTTLSNLTAVGTIMSGTWNASTIGDAYMIKSGDWTGMFDGREGSYYLDRGNHNGTQLSSSILDFSTSTRSLLSSSATGLSYSTTTGVLSLTSGYVVPLTASTTEWSNKVSSQWTTSSSNIYYTSGNVGVGTTTPTYKLDVLGTIRTSDASGSGIELVHTTSAPRINMGNASLSSKYFTLGAYSGVNNIESGNRDLHIFNTSSDTVGITYKSTGNVGVGTTTPGSILTLGSGQLELPIGNATAPSLRFSGASNSGMYSNGTNGIALSTGGIERMNISAAGNMFLSGAASVQMAGGSAAVPFLSFGNTTAGIYRSPGSTFGISTNSTSRMFIDASGNIGIGTTTPADILQVFGDMRVGNSGVNGCIKNFAGTGIVGVCSSDERLKTNIVDFSDGYLDKMVKLKAITYNWNEQANSLNKVNTTVTNYGLLAQNVEQYFPELVTMDSNGYKQVNYSRLPLYLLKAVQELSVKVSGIFDGTGKVHVKELCIEDVCVTKQQLQQMLQGQNIQSAPVITTPPPVVIEPVSETVVEDSSESKLEIIPEVVVIAPEETPVVQEDVPVE